MKGNGGVYIKKLIEDGALVEDFKTELLGIYPLKECQKRETELAMTSLFPKGLNGNAGSMIVHTDEARAMMRITRKRQKTHCFYSCKDERYKDTGNQNLKSGVRG